MEAESKALAVGDWVSISVEIERWNLLIFQLDDVIAIKTFINRLPLVLDCQPRIMFNKENNCGNVELSVVGKTSDSSILHNIRQSLLRTKRVRDFLFRTPCNF